ncbi:MAG TPA: chorismate-binding protein [Prolixibacteraceae bacterium]|nr:chorismate-binding protein [Prolixibacteraceae bacterium]
MNFIHALQFCIDRNLVFAAYRLPHSDAVRLLVQKSPELHQVQIDNKLFEQKGFVISPFSENENNHSFFIKPDLNYISTDYDNFNDLFELGSVPHLEPNFENGQVSKKEFVNQVASIKKAIAEKRFEKAVLSRIKIIDRNYRSKLTDVFQMLIASYSNAFIYLFNLNGQMWIGATPEPLLCSNKNDLETVSLAGTREFNAENLNLHNWSKKELTEQELVTCFIEEALHKFNITKYLKNGPYTKKAGNLVHLRTDFTVKQNRVNGLLGQLVHELHPTSAVCGLPKQAAMSFLLNIEKHNRKFYSGFLGPINIDEQLQLFVNLRCMQVLCDKLVLYIGAGITSDSEADDEWTETEIKADTLLSVIHKV